MSGAWSELALVVIAIGGPAAISVVWQAIDDRRAARREGAQR